MAHELVDDELWKVIEPLIPPAKNRRFRWPGRKPLEARKALTGILFVLKTGIPWNMLPQEMGCGCGSSCWRRLQSWQQAGVWQKLHETLLAQLRGADKLDWSRAIVDSSSIRAVYGGKKRARALRIGGKLGVSITSSPMRRAFRSLAFSLRRTSTMSPS
jgi:transposase